MAQPQMIIDDPESAAEHFNNAWIYQMMQRNSAKAFAEMQTLYANYAPKKLDAAQLYFDSGNAGGSGGPPPLLDYTGNAPP